MAHLQTHPQPWQCEHLALCLLRKLASIMHSGHAFGACVLLLVWSAAYPAHAAPHSADYMIERIVPASAFHGVHGLALIGLIDCTLAAWRARRSIASIRSAARRRSRSRRLTVWQTISRFSRMARWSGRPLARVSSAPATPTDRSV